MNIKPYFHLSLEKRLRTYYGYPTFDTGYDGYCLDYNDNTYHHNDCKNWYIDNNTSCPYRQNIS